MNGAIKPMYENDQTHTHTHRGTEKKREKEREREDEIKHTYIFLSYTRSNPKS